MLPMLGLLAGTAYLGQRYAMPAIREAMQKQQGRINQGLLAGLPEDAGVGEVARKLYEGGGVSGADYLNYGFPGDPYALEMFKHGLQQNDTYLAGRQKIVDTFQPQLDALTSQNESITNLLGVAKEYGAMSPFERNRAIGSPEGRAVRAQLAELEEQGFADFKRRVYGEAEPPPAELARLHQSYLTFTGGGVLSAFDQGRFDTVSEVYDRRLQENTRRGEGLRNTFDRNLRAFEESDLMLPGSLFGGVDVTGGDGGATRSDRNMPPLLNMESGGRWGATNDEGMAGRAQFSPARLDEVREGLGVNFSTQEFLRSPQLQKAAEAWHFNDIEDYIQDNGLDAYIGKQLGRVPITLQGMLNVAHLGGKHGLSRFLATGGKYNPADSNGVHLSDYLRLGAG